MTEEERQTRNKEKEWDKKSKTIQTENLAYRREGNRKYKTSDAWREAGKWIVAVSARLS